ncbi:MAG TPA: hypothetical protein VFH83_13610 [Spirochaetia bacterium]|nr:hypothetical protein [Spirochaetia bacterium]
MRQSVGDQRRKTAAGQVEWAGRSLTPRRKQVIVAVDHGLPLDRVEGLERPLGVMRSLAANSEVDGTIASLGLLKTCDRLGIDLSRMARILTVDYVGFQTSGGTTILSTREIILEPEAAAEVQAHAFKMFLNLYDDSDLLMGNIKDAERFVSAAVRTGVPTLLEVVFYGNRGFADPRTQAAVFTRGCRLAMELGADALKVPMIEDAAAAAEAIDSVGVPTFVLGGARWESRQALQAELSRIAALPVCGVMFGRNVWQTEDIAQTVSEIAGVLRPQGHGSQRKGAERKGAKRAAG